MGLAAFVSKILLLVEMVLDKFVSPASFLLNNNQWEVNVQAMPTDEGIQFAMGIGGILNHAVMIVGQLMAFFVGPHGQY